MQKKSNKRKNQGCTFWATPALFYAEQKELASLKQLFVLNAPKSTSASRPKSEANSLYATLLRSFFIVKRIEKVITSTFYVTYIFNNEPHKKDKDINILRNIHIQTAKRIKKERTSTFYVTYTLKQRSAFEFPIGEPAFSGEA